MCDVRATGLKWLGADGEVFLGASTGVVYWRVISINWGCNSGRQTTLEASDGGPEAQKTNINLQVIDGVQPPHFSLFCSQMF